MMKKILIGLAATVAIVGIAIIVFMVTGPDIEGPEIASAPIDGPASDQAPVALGVPAAQDGAGDTVAAVPADTATAVDLPLATLLDEQDVPPDWQRDFEQTDFTKSSIEFASILSGGPRKDGIPAIDDPQFGSVADAQDVLSEMEPVISLAHNGETKAYPLSILMWHEIVNDTIGGTPVAVTFCPLCNSTIVFVAEMDGQALDFGTTGRLRMSDLVMYDRQTQSWWQQYQGIGIIGEYTGRRLAVLPARVESFASFKERHPDGQVLKIPEEFNRNYGTNPYHEYDQAGVAAEEQRSPFLFSGDLPEDIAPLAYVVAIGGQAWSLDLVRNERRVETEGGLIIEWSAGQNSVLDQTRISSGQDIGNVTVQREQGGVMVDVAYDVSFAFAFNAFNPDGEINQ